MSSETIAGDAAGNYTIVRTFTRRTTAATALLRRRPSQFKTRLLLSLQAFLPTTRLSALTSSRTQPASDNCGEVTIEEVSETIAGDCAGSYTIVRTFTATDDAGNNTSATQTITVEDTTAPEFPSVPDDYTAECSDELIWTTLQRLTTAVQ